MDKLIKALDDLNITLADIIIQMNIVNADLKDIITSPETQNMINHLNTKKEPTGDEDKDLAEGEGVPFKE